MKKQIFSFLLGCIVSLASNYFLERHFAYRDKIGSLTVGFGERVALSSVSPDKSVRVMLIEKRTLAGRNFDLVLRSNSLSMNHTVFYSSDQERNSGWERIVWSDNGEKFALLSTNFLLGRHEKNKLKITTGEILVLVYDLNKKILFCPESMSQLNHCSPLETSFIQEFKKRNNF